MKWVSDFFTFTHFESFGGIFAFSRQELNWLEMWGEKVEPSQEQWSYIVFALNHFNGRVHTFIDYWWDPLLFLFIMVKHWTVFPTRRISIKHSHSWMRNWAFAWVWSRCNRVLPLPRQTSARWQPLSPGSLQNSTTSRHVVSGVMGTSVAACSPSLRYTVNIIWKSGWKLTFNHPN